MAMVYKCGDNVDTDVIIPARYLNTSDPVELAKHAMEDYDKDFLKKISKGDVIVAGANFGCGSSREHAPVALKAAGISCVVAKSFARIFYRNAINVGLPAIECTEAAEKASAGDEVNVVLEKGEIKNVTKGETYKAKPMPEFMMQIFEAGGLIPFLQRKYASRK
jgi:3-isopropylmalate/(R)-2-methylmalate dehydratase small subunit